VNEPVIERLTGVYDANGTLRGELSYWIGARLGRRHCALCDVTHGSVREKPAWRAACAGLAVPMTTVHLDERTPEVAAATAGTVPAIVAHTNTGVHVLVGPADIGRADGDPARLVEIIEAAARTAGFAWEGSPT